MHRFFVVGDLQGQIDIVNSDVHHIRKVLRMCVDDSLVLVNEQGKVAQGKIIFLENDKVCVKVEKMLVENSEEKLKVILGQGISKGEKMDLVVQKAVELGVTDIIPLTLERSVVRYDDKKATAKQERWQKIAVEAAKQCKRNFLPNVHKVMSLTDALKDFQADVRIVAYECEKKRGLRSYLKSLDKNIKSIFIVVGPEGGLTNNEVHNMQENGFVEVGLGSRILRTETAAIVTTAIVMYELADLGEDNA